MSPDSAEGRIRIARGSFYLARELCDAWLPDISAVATLVRDGRVYLLPLRGPAAGGLLLKVRNARGDRVVHADEFLHAVGISSGAPERWVAVRWMPAMGALLLEDVVPAGAN